MLTDHCHPSPSNMFSFRGLAFGEQMPVEQQGSVAGGLEGVVAVEGGGVEL